MTEETEGYGLLVSWWGISVRVGSEEVGESDVGGVLVVETWVQSASTSEGLRYVSEATLDRS